MSRDRAASAKPRAAGRGAAADHAGVARPTSAPPSLARPVAPPWLGPALGAATFVLLAPTLARTPQSGDGAEVVMTALRGGVLHPPGFPLQAWLDRGLAALAGTQTALAIAALGLAAHAAAAGLVAATLRRLGVGAAGCALGAAAFAFFPPMWGIAVQPEVFSLAHAWVALALWLGVRAAVPARGAKAARGTASARAESPAHMAAPAGASAPAGPPAPSGTAATTGPATAAGAKARLRAATPARAAAFGLTGALGAATHPIGIAAAPAWLVAAWAELRGGARRRARLAALVATALGGTAALYLSLLALRTASPWPDWGTLRTIGDVMHHAMRVDYGTFEMSGVQGAGTLSGIGVWFAEAARTWNVALALAAIGAVALAVSPARRAGTVPILGGLLVGLAMLLRAHLPEQTYTAPELSRIGGPVSIAGALLVGLGWQVVRERFTGLAGRRALDALAVLAAVAWLAFGWPVADASHDRTLDLYTRGLAMELPPDAVYVAEGDVECFYGVPSAGGRRFPIAAPQCSLDRYQQQIAPHIEPRVFDGRRIYPTWEDVIHECDRRGLTVAGASIGYVAIQPEIPELDGLLLVARPGNREMLTRATVTAAVQLAPLTAELPALPARGHAYSRFYALRFARAYAGAAVVLRRSAAPEAGALADSVDGALRRFLPVPERRTRLRAFVAAAHAAGC